MSAIAPTAESRLKALQCHFTWDLERSTSMLYEVRDKLIDISPDDSNVWLGHIYNLQGFVQYKLGRSADPLSLFSRATEAFGGIRRCSGGPWLLVNYGNLAWLHHELGHQAESESYLSKVEALTKQHPAGEKDELHPEVYAEKAWSLTNFSKDQKLLAAEIFEKALELQPDRVEWRISQVLALVHAHKHSETGVDDDTFKNMKLALEIDPENLFLAAEYLNQRMKRGEDVKAEAFELATKILENPSSKNTGMKPLLVLYRSAVSVDAAVDLAEKALKKHPESHYLKSCLTLCYKWKILHQKEPVCQDLINKATALLRKVIAQYPDSSLVKEITLANIYGKSNHSLAQADQIYQELLQRDLEPASKQMLYNCYAKFLNFAKRDFVKSTEFNMKAAEIPIKSYHRANSVAVLQKIKEGSRLHKQVEDFLTNLKNV